MITTTAPPVTITPSDGVYVATGQAPVPKSSAPLYWAYALMVVFIFAMVSLAVYLVRR